LFERRLSLEGVVVGGFDTRRGEKEESKRALSFPSMRALLDSGKLRTSISDHAEVPDRFKFDGAEEDDSTQEECGTGCGLSVWVPQRCRGVLFNSYGEDHNFRKGVQHPFKFKKSRLPTTSHHSPLKSRQSKTRDGAGEK